MKKNLFSVLILLLLATLHAIGQETVVSGTVTSSEDGLVLPGVSVQIKSSGQGTQTNAEGKFTLRVKANDVLVFSYLGYVSQELAINNQTNINVSLKQDNKALNEVVVTALGVKQNKRSLGYSVQEITSQDITSTNQANPLNALKGKVVGVQITGSGGAAGAGTRVQVRGINSLSPSADNQPLFVIDGIPVSNATDNFGADNFQTPNRIADINPDDIESMTILKGPAASVLYGLRAANGAVVITTKSGKSGRTEVSYRTSYSFDDVANTPPIQTRYGNGNNGALASNVNTWGPPIAPGTAVYNPYDLYFKTGHQLQNSVTLSGGNDKANYYTSFSNFDQTGVTPNSEYGRTSVKMAGTYRASDKLKFDASANYVNSGGTNPRTGISSGAIFYLMRHTNTVNPADYLNPDGSQKVYNAAIDNPFYFSENSFLTDKVNRIIGNTGVDYSPNNWLNFNYKVGVDHYTDFRKSYNEVGLLISRLGSMSEQRIGYSEINSNFLARATKQINEDFSATFLLGHSYTAIKRSSLSTNGSQAVVPGLESINNYVVYTTASANPQRNIIGVFGDLKLAYKNQLFLDLTARNDWSSTLPRDNRSFFYPSASLAYIFTDALNLSKESFLSFGKLRASYAEVGKDADPYQIGVYYSTLQAFSGVSGINRNITFGSETLRPERTKGLEFGTELRFFKDKITLDANYAITNSVDQIVPVPVSYASGFDLFVTNAGEIRNNSLEFLLTANIISNKDFKWNLNANWSQTKGRVLSMPEGVNEITFNPESPWNKQIIKRGGRPGDWYGWPYRRVTDDPTGVNNGKLLIGNDGFPIVPQPLSENYLIGNAFPDWIGGLGSSFSYKNFDFSFQFNFRKGGFVNDISKWQRYITGIGAETELRNAVVVFNGVRNVGTPTAPQYVVNETPVTIDQNFYNNAFQYRLAPENNGFQDGSWIRLQNISLGYRLPKSLLPNSSFVKSASLSVTANNLWVTTPFVGFDPESSTYGAASNAVGYVGTGIPTTRNIYLGLNVTF
ncbi:SusC/RagA family TonB-linked outer membrane protein [Pedobacter glucosidilyticus]|uniref:SusC/RagA family TonB-linked outer membrane protein n=1 Tax=Pedobacter glucosidilyticus TaxID=1122941 RepID=UPI0004787B7D|nr:SusC/RagA family TonB-linked outer membrane protein [Pedobacter glucosidilyticus]